MNSIEKRIQYLWKDILDGRSKYSIMRDLKQEGIEDERIKAIMFLLRNREIKHYQKTEEHYFRNLHYLFLGVLFISFSVMSAFYEYYIGPHQYFIMFGMLAVGIVFILLATKRSLRSIMNVNNLTNNRRS